MDIHGRYGEKKKRWEVFDSAGFTKVAESITGKPEMTTQKPHRFDRKSANSRFYTE